MSDLEIYSLKRHYMIDKNDLVIINVLSNLLFHLFIYVVCTILRINIGFYIEKTQVTY